jgi:hypothetical protein
MVEEAVEEARQPQEGEVAQPQAPLGKEKEEVAEKEEAQQYPEEGEVEVALVLLPL